MGDLDLLGDLDFLGDLDLLGDLDFRLFLMGDLLLSRLRLVRTITGGFFGDGLFDLLLNLELSVLDPFSKISRDFVAGFSRFLTIGTSIFFSFGDRLLDFDFEGTRSWYPFDLGRSGETDFSRLLTFGLARFSGVSGVSFVSSFSFPL